MQRIVGQVLCGAALVVAASCAPSDGHMGHDVGADLGGHDATQVPLDAGDDLGVLEDLSIPSDVAIPPDATTMYSLRCADPVVTTWEGTGTLAVRVSVTPAAEFDLVVPVAVGSGTAVNGEDFAPPASALVVRAGSTTGLLLLSVVDDAVAEGTETTTVSFGATEFVTPVDPSRCAISIDDDDDPTWFGTNAATAVDAEDAFVGDLSGLMVVGARGGQPSSLVAVQNNPGILHRLAWSTDRFVRLSAGGFQSGKALRFPTGMGAPDAESVTTIDLGSDVVYVASERDNAMSTVSRNSILRYDTAGPGPLVATHEWNLTADLPTTTSNAGLEGITFVPDADLVAAGFRDARLGAAYDPATYGDHGGGLFLVGVETNGRIYAFALDHTSGQATRVADFPSGHDALMALEYDRSTGALYAGCDAGCDGRLTLLRIEQNPRSPDAGRFTVRRRFDRPTSLPDTNLEGIAVASDAECVDGWKPFYWTDDDALGGHSLYRDSIPCGRTP